MNTTTHHYRYYSTNITTTIYTAPVKGRDAVGTFFSIGQVLYFHRYVSFYCGVWSVLPAVCRCSVWVVFILHMKVDSNLWIKSWAGDLFCFVAVRLCANIAPSRLGIYLELLTSVSVLGVLFFFLSHLPVFLRLSPASVSIWFSPRIHFCSLLPPCSPFSSYFLYICVLFPAGVCQSNAVPRFIVFLRIIDGKAHALNRALVVDEVLCKTLYAEAVWQRPAISFCYYYFFVCRSLL